MIKIVARRKEGSKSWSQDMPKSKEIIYNNDQTQRRSNVTLKGKLL